MIAFELVCAVVVVVTVLATAAGPARAVAAQADEGDDEVTCPANLHGVPLSLDQEFAGTPRALANDEGVLVRYSLLCPYVRGNGSEVAQLTLAWSRYAADDLDCSTVELTSEPAGDGRVEGVVDHPSLSAQVTYVAAAEDVLPAVEEAATALLTEVPADAHPCVGGADTGVDASVAPSREGGSTRLPLALALAMLALTGVIVLAAVALARRSRSRARRRATAAGTDPSGAVPGEPSVGELAAALRAKRSVVAAPGPGPAPVEETESSGDGRHALEVARRRAVAERDAIGLLMAEARADLAVQREHAAAVRRLAVTASTEGEHREFLSSYAGVMALAVAATNLVSTSARRAVALAGNSTAEGHAELAGPAAELQSLHGRVIAAAERGLDDSRYWLWQNRRLAVVAAVAAMGRAVPRLVEVQRRLADRVVGLADRYRDLSAEVAALDAAVADLDRRAREAGSAPLERGGA